MGIDCKQSSFLGRKGFYVLKEVSMVKQYIRKRRFTKVIFVLGLFQLYIWITFKYLIEIMDSMRYRHNIKLVFVLISLVLDYICFFQDRQYIKEFSAIKKDYYIFSIISFIIKILFLVYLIVILPLSSKIQTTTNYSIIGLIIISLFLFIVDRVVGIKTERIEYKFEKK